MTLDEAIQHCEEKAKELRETAINDFYNNKTTLGEMAECRECAAEHAQLAAWLTDYKRINEGLMFTGRRSGKRQAMLNYLRPQGEWIIENEYKVCPFCLTGTASKDNASLPHFKFCPYCGAKMSNPKEEGQPAEPQKI